MKNITLFNTLRLCTIAYAILSILLTTACNPRDQLHCWGWEDSKLQKAVIKNDQASVEYILKQKDGLLLSKANVNASCFEHSPPLSTAASKGYLGIVKVLIDHGADIDKSGGPYHRTALTEAALNGHLAVVQYLVQQGASIEQDKCSHRALIGAATSGHLAVVQYLVQQGVDIEKRDSSGYTALTCAAMSGHLAVVQYLVQQGADIDKPGGYHRRTALMEAARRNDLFVVRHLRAGIDKPGVYYRRTALTEAARRSHLFVVRHLIKQGAGIDKQDSYGHTALMGAIKRSVIKMTYEKKNKYSPL